MTSTPPKSNQAPPRMGRISLLSLALAAVVMAVEGGAAEPMVVNIWHSQSVKKGEAFAEIVEQFNASRGGGVDSGGSNIVVKETYIGPYSQLYQKLAAAIRAGETPALAVAYESMVSRFAEAGAVVAFDDYLNDPDIGLSKESRDDIFPVFLEINKYPQFDNRMLSFPFTKSLLMLYYNIDLLKKAGYDAPPETWDEFIEICRSVKKLDKWGYALSIDPSTIDGMVFSFGGDVISDDLSRTLFDRPPALAALKVIETLIGEGLAYRIPHHTYHDRNAIATGRAAFIIRSSTTGPYLERIIQAEGRNTNWDMSIIPHGEGCKPSTVLFGANICMLETTPDVQRAAWRFVKYFASTEVTAKWAMATGYIPLRRSAAKLPEMKAFYARKKQNRRTLEVLPYARSEPNVAGWQSIRRVLLSAEADLCRGEPADAVAETLQREAQAVLDDRRGPPEREPTDPEFFIPLALVVVALLVGGRAFGMWKERD